MKWSRHPLERSDGFPDNTKHRYYEIAVTVRAGAEGFGTVVEYPSSYSFKVVTRQGRLKTIAKLIPHHSHAGPVLLAAFSTTEPEAERFALRFGQPGAPCRVMNEPFLLSIIPERQDAATIAEVFIEFMRDAQTRRRIEP